MGHFKVPQLKKVIKLKLKWNTTSPNPSASMTKSEHSVRVPGPTYTVEAVTRLLERT